MYFTEDVDEVLAELTDPATESDVSQVRKALTRVSGHPCNMLLILLCQSHSLYLCH